MNLLRRVNCIKGTGAILKPKSEKAGDCPSCKKAALLYFPAQHGKAKKSRFDVWQEEHFQCEQCGQLFKKIEG